MRVGSSFYRPAIFCAALTALFLAFAAPASADTISNGTDFQFSDTTGNPTFNAITNPTAVQVADQSASFGFGAESGTVESSVYVGSKNNPYDTNGGGSISGR